MNVAPHIVNFLLGSFGIVAALLLIGGSIALSWQKNRQRYELMRRALESGAPLPKGPPLWLASRRQALSILALGIGLLVSGSGAWWLGSGVAFPTASVSTAVAPTPEPAPPLLAEHGDRRPPHPPAPNPELERYHSARERLAVGQTAVGCGVILAILGIIRLGFTATERRFAE